MKYINKYKSKYFEVISFIVINMILFAGYLLDKEILCPDSTSYITNNIIRNPGYPLFLDLCELIFNNNYLQMAVIIQTVFLAYAIYQICFFLSKTFKLNKIWTSLMIAGVVLINIAPTLFSSTGILVYRTICTEGLTYPLALIITKIVLDAIFEESFKKLNYSLIPIIFIIIIRTQAIFFLVVYGIVYLYLLVNKHSLKQGLIKLSVIFISIILVIPMITKVYNLYYNDAYVTTPFGVTSFAIKVLYLSDVTEAIYFEDDLIQAIYVETMEQAKSQELTRNSTDEMSLLQSYTHYENSYDILFYKVYAEVFDEYTDLETPNAQLYRDEVSYIIISKLLPIHFSEYLELTFAAGIVGILRSNALFFSVDNPYQIFISMYSIMIYALSIILMCKAFKQNSKSRSGMFMLIVYLILLGNMAPSVLVHFPISRYTFLSMASFYLALFILIYTQCIRQMIKDIKKYMIF